ncbi:MAG: hypothetical protein MUE71_07860, partial [Chitinophagaceae bacterium]|nr:hypothetical protein [Chitinophagaceae bacterium]
RSHDYFTLSPDGSTLSAADRIEYLKIALSVPRETPFHFTGWNLFSTEYGTIDIADISFSRTIELGATAGLTTGKDANTELNMKDLEPTFSGFAEVFPEAVFNVLFRPVPGEVVKPFYYLFLAELYALWLFILFVMVHFLKKLRLLSPTPEAVALLIFGIVNLLIIGYTITNTGAIIRYRSIFLPCIGYFFFNLLLVYPSFFSKNRFLSMLSSLFFRAKNP